MVNEDTISRQGIELTGQGAPLVRYVRELSTRLVGKFFFDCFKSL